MNKCLSLVHLTSRMGSQSSGSNESISWFLRCPQPDLDPPCTKSVASRPTLIAPAPCSELRHSCRAGNHLPKTPQLRLLTSSFCARPRARRTLFVSSKEAISTVRYLRPSRSQHMREKLNEIFLTIILDKSVNSIHTVCEWSSHSE